MNKLEKSRNSLVNSALLVASAAASTLPFSALALESENEQTLVEDIVVTASKRNESVQTIAMSVTALGSEELERSGVENFRDYAVRVPNLSFGYTNSLGGAAQNIALRGLFGTGTTGLYLDETPLVASVDPRVLDLQRIEVLRGPQGTLYGARSMGGTVRLITNQPDPTNFSAAVRGVGSYTRSSGVNGSADASLNIPLISDIIGVRMTGFFETESGVYDRVPSAQAPVPFDRNKNVDSAKRLGGQIAAQARLLDGNLKITPRALFQQSRTDGRPLADKVPGNFVNERLFDVEEAGKDSWALFTLTAEYDAGFGTFLSSTAQFDRRIRDSEDFSEWAVDVLGISPAPAIIRARSTSDVFAQEFRFSSAFSGPFQITAGAFYQKSDTLLTFPPTPVPGFTDNMFNQDLRTLVIEKAVFAEGSFELAKGLRVTAGLRAFDNKVDFTGSQDGALVAPQQFAGVQKESGFTPKLGVQYLFQDAQLYATAAKGFRIGGVNSLSNLLCARDLEDLGLTPERAQSFDSDQVWSYELGVKSRLLDGRLTLNGAAFRIDWSDVQQVTPLSRCGFSVTVNAGRARSEGGELEARFAVNQNFNLGLAMGYTDARIVDPGAFGGFTVGQRIQHVPRWTGSLNADYDFNIAETPAFVRADLSYVGRSVSYNNSTANPRQRPGYSLFNIRTGVTLDNVEITMFADNLFDENANLSDTPPLAIELEGRPRIYASRPRTLGLEIRAKF